ncbi:hypothetical protein VTI74DRAFT_1561 [Chaetomium olivicolor]
MFNTTLGEPARSVPPAAFLFRPAWPAVSETSILARFRRRQLDVAVCEAGGTTCPQGGWCCGAGETCSLVGGACFCCPSGGGGAGCTRVCAIGDFKCGSICCAETQTSQIAISIVVPVAVVLLVSLLWFLIFRRPNNNSSSHNRRGHRRWGTGTSCGAESRGCTPPPVYSKSGLDAVVVVSQTPGQGQGNEEVSLHERFLAGGNTERAWAGQGEGEAIEMGEIRAAAGTAATGSVHYGRWGKDGGGAKGCLASFAHLAD